MLPSRGKSGGEREYCEEKEREGGKGGAYEVPLCFARALVDLDGLYVILSESCVEADGCPDECGLEGLEGVAVVVLESKSEFEVVRL